MSVNGKECPSFFLTKVDGYFQCSRKKNLPHGYPLSFPRQNSQLKRGVLTARQAC